MEFNSWFRFYFLKMKYTAKTKHAIPAKWFHLNDSFLKKTIEKRTNTTSVMTS